MNEPHDDPPSWRAERLRAKLARERLREAYRDSDAAWNARRFNDAALGDPWSEGDGFSLHDPWNGFISQPDEEEDL